MPTTIVRTLKEMREQAINPVTGKRGLTSTEAAALIAAELGRPSRHFSSVLHMETRGTNTLDVLEAVTRVYGVSLDEARAAAKAARESHEKKS